jgi:hypothetical protein
MAEDNSDVQTDTSDSAMKRFLPLGSVILLRGSTQECMIVGRAVVMKESNKFVDYEGVLFPEGMIDGNVLYFQAAQIYRVLHEGLVDEAEEVLEPQLEDARRKHAASNVKNANSGGHLIHITPSHPELRKRS